MHTLAIIGFGGMGGWHAQNIMERVPELKLKGAFDIRPEALDTFCQNERKECVS